MKTLGLAFFSFVTTNLDDFILLTVLFSASAVSFRKIIVGQFVGMIGILLLSYSAAFVGSLVLAPQNMRFLGLIPLTVGVRKLYTTFRLQISSAKKTPLGPSSGYKPETLPIGVLNVAVMTLANGGDNIAVYSGLFGEKSSFEIILFSSIFLILTGIWCLLSYVLSSYKKWQEWVGRFNSFILSYAFIGIGICIILKIV